MIVKHCGERIAGHVSRDSTAIEAFDLLLERGVDINLIVVGKEGWKGFASKDMRHEIVKTCQRMRSHRELNNHLFWMEGISDEFLEQIYEGSQCLIVSSAGEGFGLPLIEAARHQLPLIVRDIPIFREAAGEHAFYFEGMTREALASAVETWLGLYQAGVHPKSIDMPWLTWEESAEQLMNVILGNLDGQV